MKRLFTILLLSISLISFSQETKIFGKLTNISEGDSLTLMPITSQTPESLMIPVSKKGKFEYTYKSTSTDFCKLYISQDDFILLVVKPGEQIEINADAKALSKEYSITGSEESIKTKSAISTILTNSIEVEAIKAQAQNDIDSLENAKTSYILNTIKNDPSSLASIIFIDMLDPIEYKDVYYLVDSALKGKYPNNPIVKSFENKVSSIRMQTNKSTLEVGSLVPDIILKDINGKEIALSSLRGKVVLIDFWATWCRPCLAEINNIKEAYPKYNKKGFEVYSVSTDRDKAKWEAFTAQQPLPWISVHDTEHNYGSQFQVTSIPFTMLIGKDGKIIAKNVRGPALEQYLSQLLK